MSDCILREAVWSTSLSSGDSLDDSKMSNCSLVLAAGAGSAGELGRGRSVSLSSLQSGGVRLSRVARREAFACSAALRRGVSRADTSATGRGRRVWVYVYASGDLAEESAEAFG